MSSLIDRRVDDLRALQRQVRTASTLRDGLMYALRCQRLKEELEQAEKEVRQYNDGWHFQPVQ
jgi:hypothetical protein